MTADLQKNVKDIEERMESTIDFLSDTLARIRAGRANPRILDGIVLDYYGTTTPLSGVASISAPDARTIVVQPWEKKMLRDVEKAIQNSDVGITPDNNGEIIRLTIPPLTEERRRGLSKQAKQEAEDAKVSIRNARREAIDTIKKTDKLPEDVVKDWENEVQKIHDKYIKRIDEIYAEKEKEIMTV